MSTTGCNLHCNKLFFASFGFNFSHTHYVIPEQVSMLHTCLLWFAKVAFDIGSTKCFHRDTGWCCCHNFMRLLLTLYWMKLPCDSSQQPFLFLWNQITWKDHRKSFQGQRSTVTRMRWVHEMLVYMVYLLLSSVSLLTALINMHTRNLLSGSVAGIEKSGQWNCDSS